ncbi:MAG: glycosyltransferase family 2 protein [Planctomycetota bacterium]
MGQKLTVLIPCKDECHNICSCIHSVRGIADEVLVADSGSTDGTPETARELDDCRVIRRPWNGYAAFKNWAIAQARHEWVLIVDADERVTPELAEEIRGVLAAPPGHIDAFRIRHRTFFLGHEIRFSGRNTTSACRLIRRDACRYKAVRVHEEIDIAANRVGRLRNRFIHYEYRSYEHFFAKRVQYTKLGAEDRWEAGARTGTMRLCFRPFLRFLQLYVLRLGFLDGLAGFQVCMLTAFFNTFIKQARLWEMEHGRPQDEVERAQGTWAAVPSAVSRRLASPPTVQLYTARLPGDPQADSRELIKSACDLANVRAE